MKVRCTQLIETSGPERGQPRASHPSIAVGDEFVVLSVLIDPMRDDPWRTALQVLEPSGRPVWRPGRMFETITTTIPSNWTAEVWSDGSLHLAPAAWLRDGFWDAFWSNGPSGQEAGVFQRELETILRDA